MVGVTIQCFFWKMSGGRGTAREEFLIDNFAYPQLDLRHTGRLLHLSHISN